MSALLASFLYTHLSTMYLFFIIYLSIYFFSTCLFTSLLFTFLSTSFSSTILSISLYDWFAVFFSTYLSTSSLATFLRLSSLPIFQPVCLSDWLLSVLPIFLSPFLSIITYVFFVRLAACFSTYLSYPFFHLPFYLFILCQYLHKSVCQTGFFLLYTA